MRQNKFKKGDIINNLIILDKDKIVKTNNGSKKTYWICKCKICGSIKSKSTQTIENCKSCGCKQRERNGKVKNSGRKTKQGTNFYINCLISIYKSNAKKRNVKFDLESNWDLTFKTYDELVKAYEKQGALSKDIYLEAIENTNVMADSIEEFSLDYSKKYPKLYNDSMGVFKQKILDGIKERGVDKYEKTAAHLVDY